MKKFLLLAVAALGVLALLNTVAPAADVKTTTQDLPVDFTQFFCVRESDAINVRDVYGNSGDTRAIAFADNLVKNRQCEYLDYVKWWQVNELPCQTLANGYCIAVQPAFTYLEDGSRVNGFTLVQPRVETGQAPPPTAAMGSERNIILDMN